MRALVRWSCGALVRPSDAAALRTAALPVAAWPVCAKQRCLSTASVCAHLIQHRLARRSCAALWGRVVGRRAMAAVCGLVGQVHSASAHGSMRPVACLRRTCDAHGMTPPHSVMASDAGRPASERPWRAGAGGDGEERAVWAPTGPTLRPSITDFRSAITTTCVITSIQAAVYLLNILPTPVRMLRLLTRSAGRPRTVRRAVSVLGAQLSTRSAHRAGGWRRAAVAAAIGREHASFPTRGA